MRPKQLNVVLDPDLHHSLRQYAYNRDKSMSVIIREEIRKLVRGELKNG